MCKSRPALKAVTLAAAGKGEIHKLAKPPTGFSAASSPFAASGGPDSISAAEPQRVCSHCSRNHTACNTWRRGPAGRGTLCNRCGIIYLRHGVIGLESVPKEAIAAAPELAAVPVSQLHAAQPPLERISSAGSNYQAQSWTAQPSAAIAAPAMPVTGNKTSSSVAPAATAVQPRLTQQPTSSTAEQSTERSTTRKSLRQKRPRVVYDDVYYMQPGRASRAKKSSTSNPPASTGISASLKAQRPKRRRDATGEVGIQNPEKVPKMTSSLEASAASRGVRQAYAAGAVQHMEVDLSGSDIRAEAPMASKVRKSRRVAEQKARRCEIHTASAAAAAEVDEAAEVLLGLARCCWVDSLLAATGGELDD